jgi:large subunit ribosomal protein L23
MALFGRKQAPERKNAQTPRGSSIGTLTRNLSSVIIRPRITEKSAGASDHNVYTFVVRRDATKYDVRDAVKLLFKVTPRKITIVNRAPRRAHSRARSRKVTVPGLKKANVFLKKGDRIDFT